MQSMGSAGDPLDNAMCESFFATLKCELIVRTRFLLAGATRTGRSATTLRTSTTPRRIHSAIGYESPAHFENLNHAA